MLLNTMYELPDMEGVVEVIVSEATVKENKPPEYVYEDKKKAKAKGKKDEPEVVAK
jgi:ATP-dependent Clp protease ATP-binding subunit ClpX